MFTEFLDANPLLPLLVKKCERAMYPKALNRAKWADIGEKNIEALIENGREALETPYPALAATQFMAFARTGDRAVFEKPYFLRRRLLMAAVLAECAEHKGAYMDRIADGLWLILEESFWGISAHNGSSHEGMRPANERMLPDIENPYIDLFAAQTGALVSYIIYLLGAELDAISPVLRRRAQIELDRRIFKPFRYHDDFWWMGMIRRDMNNWTPWIISNVLVSLSLSDMDDALLACDVSRAMRMLDSYLRCMPEDGGCDEGAAYWNMAGGSLLDCLCVIEKLTGGRASFFSEPKIRNIGLFPMYAHVTGEWFINFADCDAKPRLDGERVYEYGRRISSEPLMALGIELASRQGVLGAVDTPEMSRALAKLFSSLPPAKPCPAPEYTLLPDTQLWIRRAGEFYAAAKGGHNQESHNHNDVGAFILYYKEQPVIVDAGNIVYTAKTFGEERYTLWNTRSRNHNLPLIGGFEQLAGAEHRARGFSADENGVSMDIAACYPDEAGVKSLKRELSLTEGGLMLRDTISLGEKNTVSWVFLLTKKPALLENEARLCGVKLCWQGEMAVELTELPTTDERIARVYPESLWRLCITSCEGTEFDESFVVKAED